MTTTTDTHPNPHRESIVNPGEYTHIAAFYVGPSEAMQDAYEGEHRALIHDLGSDWLDRTQFHRNGGCAHCGANFLHGALFQHPTHGLVALGHTCAAERFTLNSNLELRVKRIKQRAAARLRAERAREAFHSSLTDDDREAFSTDHYIIRDILAQGEKWGSVSERQLALVHKLAKEVREAATAQAAAGVPQVQDIPVPLGPGRHTVTGEVLSLKEKDTGFGFRWVMTLQVTTPEGQYRLWGTAPSGEFDRGDTITVTIGNVEVSSGDTSFAFYKRPKLVKVS